MLSCDVFVPDFNTLFGRVHSQLAAGGNAPFINCVLLSPTQGARGACSPQTGLQRGSLQQTVPTSNPGAELFLAVPPGTVSSTQEPSPSDSPATGPWPESVQHSGIHGWGHSRYTPVSLSITWTPANPSQHPILLYTPTSPLVQRQSEITLKTDSLSTCALWLCVVKLRGWEVTEGSCVIPA